MKDKAGILSTSNLAPRYLVTPDYAELKAEQRDTRLSSIASHLLSGGFNEKTGHQAEIQIDRFVGVNVCQERCKGSESSI